MIVLLDPALLLTRTPEGPLAPDEERELSAVIDDAGRVCRDVGASIPAADDYWTALQTQLVRPLRRRATDPRLKQGLDRLLRYAVELPLAGIPTSGKTKLWGVRELFAWSRLPNPWFAIMERAFIGCAQLVQPPEQRLILITRLFAGRNKVEHPVERSVVIEKTRWRLYLHVAGHAPVHVRCVRNPRNVAVEWTARFDEKLPDGGHYPFCPPPRWWRGPPNGPEAWRTCRSKPAWIDRFGNGWAQPTTGGDHHWDVFLEDPKLAEAVGIDPINVVAWGNTEGKTPGEIHHVPADKKGHFRGRGWTCPPA